MLMPILKNFKSTICLLLTISIIFVGGCVSPALAQSPLPIQDQPLPENIPQSSPTYANMLAFNLIHTFSCIVVGQSIINQPCVEYKMVSGLDGITESVPVLASAQSSKGILGFVGSTVDGLYISKPIASSEFLANFGDSLGLVKTAHAQVGGSGNGVLAPVYTLWVVSRNLCYLLMIVIFLSVGLMIMFRQKINPQTVISVQSALPGLVIGLILITFSYFMASVITDMAFIGTDLVGFFFQQAQPPPAGKQSISLLSSLSQQNPLTIFPRFVDATWYYDFGIGVDKIFSNLDENGPASIAIRSAIAFATYQYASQVGGMLAAPIGGIAGLAAGFTGPGTPLGGLGVGAGAASTVGSLLVGAGAALKAYNSPGTIATYAIWVILMVMLLVAMARLLLALLKNYLSIIFYTITAPFFFLMASLPGRSAIINEWVRNMLCAVLSFPAVIAVIYFAYYMLTADKGYALADPTKPFLMQCTGSPCTSPIGITGIQTLPLFGGLNLSLINYLLAFSAMVITPSIPDIICKAIGKIGPYGQMIEQSLTGSQKEASGRIRGASQAPNQVAKDFGGAKETFVGKGGMRWDPVKAGYRYVPEPSSFTKTFFTPKH
jgi:hypothetical protein